jgi:outer membrane protein TolC
MRKSNTLKLFFVAFAVVHLSFAGFAQRTIEQCQEKARNNYPKIKDYELIEKAKEFTISNANKAYLPQVGLNLIGAYVINGFPSVVPGTSSGDGKFNFIGILQLNQNIWDGGNTRSEKKIAEADASVSRNQTDVDLYQLQERINQLYFGILLVDEQVKQIELLKENLSHNLKRVRESAANGLAYSTDVDEVKGEVLVLDQRTTEFRFVRKAYADMLGLMIGEPIGTEETLQRPEPMLNSSEETLNRPELLLFDNQQALVKARSEMTKVSYMPKVGILGIALKMDPGMSLGPQSIQSLSLVGLNVTWNTAGLYRAKNNRSLSAINFDRISTERDVFIRNTRIQILQSRAELDKHRMIIEKDIEIVQLKEGIRKAYETKYENGICSMNDLLIAINKESESRSNKALHEIQQLSSAYTYKAITGQ